MPQHGHSMAAYQFYLVNLHTESPALTATESYEAPYYDYLQAPLQPLMDNLESSTYETFESTIFVFDSFAVLA
jgi:protein arginine N-methyltransferase 5